MLISEPTDFVFWFFSLFRSKEHDSRFHLRCMVFVDMQCSFLSICEHLSHCPNLIMKPRLAPLACSTRKPGLNLTSHIHSYHYMMYIQYNIKGCECIICNSLFRLVKYLVIRPAIQIGVYISVYYCCQHIQKNSWEIQQHTVLLSNSTLFKKQQKNRIVTL